MKHNTNTYLFLVVVKLYYRYFFGTAGEH